MSMQQLDGEQHVLFDRHKGQILELIDGLGPDRRRLSLILVATA